MKIGETKMSVIMSRELRGKLHALSVADRRADMHYVVTVLEAHVEREERKAKVSA